MPKDLSKFHPQPCAECGHRDMHGEVAGCIAVASTNPDTWCPCDTYVPPVSLPYAGTSGHSGSSTSRERAERRDASGLTSATQKAVLEMARQGGANGVTVAEAREHLGQHHGTVSGALSVLHMDGILERITERRNRCQVYVVPESVLGRETVPHRSNAAKAAVDPQAVRKAITDAYYDARNAGGTMEDAADKATAAVMALL